MKKITSKELKQMMSNVDNLSDKDKKQLVKNIEARYIRNFKKNINKWISISDFITAVETNPNATYFVVSDNRTKRLLERVRHSKIKLISAKEFANEIKKLTDIEKQEIFNRIEMDNR